MSERSACCRWYSRRCRIRRNPLGAGSGREADRNDLLIAAHAYATGATIVTANADEFKRIRGLNVENWLV
jgi:predicted nucleic acid-binding protein